MSNKFKAALLYFAAMMVMFYGGITMVGHGMNVGEITALVLWATTYGGLLACSAHYDGQSVKRL